MKHPPVPLGYRLLATAAQRKAAFPKRSGDLVCAPCDREWTELHNVASPLFWSDRCYARKVAKRGRKAAE